MNRKEAWKELVRVFEEECFDGLKLHSNGVGGFSISGFWNFEFKNIDELALFAINRGFNINKQARAYKESKK